MGNKNSSREVTGRIITNREIRSISRNKMFKRTKGKRRICKMRNLLRKYRMSKLMMVKIRRESKGNRMMRWMWKMMMMIRI
jgi:hypothetical protein